MAAGLCQTLILIPIIRIEALRGVGEILGGNQFREVDTFDRPLRLAHGPDANGADRNAETRVATKVAIGAAEAFWLTLIAALAAWVVSPSENPLHGSTGSSPGCLFGKGGVICNGSATAAQKMATEDADPCLSLGKGGRYCPPAKQDDDPFMRQG
jgi:hypothetical protein